MSEKYLLSNFSKTESNRELENSELTKQIKEVHVESKQRYGAPKIHNILSKKGFNVSLKCVHRIDERSQYRVNCS